MRSQFVFQEIWIGLRRNLTMTMALIVVVAISLSLLGTGLLFVKQVDRTRTFWQGKVELSIYLCIKTSPQPNCKQGGPATDELADGAPVNAAGWFTGGQTDLSGTFDGAVDLGNKLAASAAVKYTWMAPHVLVLAEGELTLVPGEQRDFTLDEIAIRRGAVCRQILDLADDARRLARELDLR